MRICDLESSRSIPLWINNRCRRRMSHLSGLSIFLQLKGGIEFNVVGVKI